MVINSIFEAMEQGVLICDRMGRILYGNKSYCEFLGHSLQEIQGEHITVYRPNAQVPAVLRSGHPIEGMIRREGSQEYFASIYPIIEKGEIRGSISIVTTIASHQLKVHVRPSTLAQRVHQFEQDEIRAAIDYYGDTVDGRRKAAADLGISLATLYNKLKA